jgi:hypothetical protein
LGYDKYIKNYVEIFNNFEIYIYSNNKNKFYIDKTNINISLSNIIIVLYEKLFYKLQDKILDNQNVSKFIFFKNNIPSFINKFKNIQVNKTIKIKNILEILITNKIIQQSEVKYLEDKKLDIKQKYRNFCNSELTYVYNWTLPIIQQNKNYEAVIIETRKLEHIEILVRNCIYKLGSDWSHTIICGNYNYNSIKKMVDKIKRDIKIIKLNQNTLTQNEYNNMLLTSEFWNLFIGEKILIYQEDTLIFNNNIIDFIHWDYIGGAFKHDCVEGINVGNGGLSLRSKTKMLNIIEQVPINNINYNELKPFVKQYISKKRLDKIPEDIYFSTYMQKMHIGHVADFESAQKFSSETIYYENSFGMHCLWHCCPNDWLNKIKKMMKKEINESILFHKYDLNISDKEQPIPYTIIQKQNKNNNYVCHIHIFDLDKFSEYINKYLINLKLEFNIIITFCNGDYTSSVYNDTTLLKITNKGYDIGGKLVALEYIKNENINVDYILFLHSKTNIITRNRYFNPLVKNMQRIKLI